MLSPFSQMLLMEGLGDWVPLAALRTAFWGKEKPSMQVASLEREKPSSDEFARRFREATEPLLREGLMTMGDLSGSHGFSPWELTVERCLDKFKDLFLKSNDVTDLWSYSIWLCLTPKGEALADELYQLDPDPLHIHKYWDL